MLTSKRVVIAFVLAAALLVAWPAIAVRVVNYTLQPVTANDCIAVSVVRNSNGSGGTVLVTTFTFQVKDAGGVVRETGATTMQLTPAQATSLGSFVTANGVPAFNSENNL